MYKIEEHKLKRPEFSEIAEVISNGLKKNFKEVDVQVVPCPDLREKPFMLASEGLCGSPCIADVGGVEYLIPLAKREKVYNFRDIAKQIERTNVFLIGAGAGPRPHVGVNCEMMANLKLGENENISTHIAKLNESGSCELIRLEENTQFCLLGNLFISDGKPGEVIKIIAKQRNGPENFVSAIRHALGEKFEEPVGMGGVFIIKRGKAKLHIMPDYSASPLSCENDVNNWLKFFDMPAPLSCLSTFVSSDPGWNLRVEHTHCFSDHGVGGHYHEDTTADDVEYEAYFNVADTLLRVDRPEEVLTFGKD